MWWILREKEVDVQKERGRFRDFPRRSREDGGEFKRRSREGKDSVETKEEKEPQHIVKDQSNLVDSNEVVVKKDDNAN